MCETQFWSNVRYMCLYREESHFMALLLPIREMQRAQNRLIAFVADTQKEVLNATEELITMMIV